MIVDAHVHLYDPSRPQGVPWPRPDDEFLYRPVLPEHLKAAAAPAGVAGAVVVEASEWVEDNDWLLDLARRDPFLLGVVGRLEPGAPGFAARLERYAADPLFLGVRVPPSVVERLDDSAVAADAEKLAAADLELDLLMRPALLPHAARLARRLPELRIVINHAANIPMRGGPPDPAWVDGLAAAAESPRVFCKVSSLPTLTGRAPAPTEPEFYAPVLDALWSAFGEDRLIYGSDWPVSERFASYADTLRLAQACVSPRGRAAAEKFFWRNAQAAYQWRSE